MAFRFALASVLKYRQDLEHRELLRLEQRYAELAAAQAEFWKAEENIVLARKEREHTLSQGTTAVHLQLALEYDARLRRRRESSQKALAEAQASLRQQLQAYHQARQSRDALEELRKKQFEAYRKEEGRSEQRQRDELFLLRRRARR